MFKRGLVIGKFYPPHKGHKYLIDTAKAQCEELTVIIGWKRSETIHGNLRGEWLKKIHPDVYIKVIEDNKLDDDDSESWAKYTKEILGYTPDAVFTSEDYGDPFAKFLGATHILVDKNRTSIPISATIIRKDPVGNAKYLEPPIRGYFAKRISILGAESTGKTTLAKDLAKHYKTVWVPEYGRYYSEGKFYGGPEATWRTEEFLQIAKSQDELEDRLAENSNGLVICDTNSFTTSVWHERYLNFLNSELEKLTAKRQYDLYIVAGDEIPFEDDGVRDSEHLRHSLNERFMEKLAQQNKKFIVVTGNREQRLKQATEAINQIFKTSV